MERLTKLARVRNVDIRQRVKQAADTKVVRMKQRTWKLKVDGMDV